MDFQSIFTSQQRHVFNGIVVRLGSEQLVNKLSNKNAKVVQKTKIYDKSKKQIETWSCVTQGAER